MGIPLGGWEWDPRRTAGAIPRGLRGASGSRDAGSPPSRPPPRVVDAEAGSRSLPLGGVYGGRARGGLHPSVRHPSHPTVSPARGSSSWIGGLVAFGSRGRLHSGMHGRRLRRCSDLRCRGWCVAEPPVQRPSPRPERGESPSATHRLAEDEVMGEPPVLRPPGRGPRVDQEPRRGWFRVALGSGAVSGGTGEQAERSHGREAGDPDRTMCSSHFEESFEERHILSGPTLGWVEDGCDVAIRTASEGTRARWSHPPRNRTPCSRSGSMAPPAKDRETTGQRASDLRVTRSTLRSSSGPGRRRGVRAPRPSGGRRIFGPASDGRVRGEAMRSEPSSGRRKRW